MVLQTVSQAVDATLGRWPKDVDPTDAQQVARFRKKVTGFETRSYAPCGNEWVHDEENNSARPVCMSCARGWDAEHPAIILECLRTFIPWCWYPLLCQGRVEGIPQASIHIHIFNQMEKDEDYIRCTVRLGAVVEELIKENNALDIYEEYFAGGGRVFSCR